MLSVFPPVRKTGNTYRTGCFVHFASLAPWKMLHDRCSTDAFEVRSLRVARSSETRHSSAVTAAVLQQPATESRVYYVTWIPSLQMEACQLVVLRSAFRDSRLVITRPYKQAQS
jgi:hypothetical protein